MKIQYLVSILVLFCRLYLRNASKVSIVLNALDSVGLDGATWFLESLKVYTLTHRVENIYLFHKKADEMEKSVKMKLSNGLNDTGFFTLPYPTIIPFPDLRFNRTHKDIEQVTTILHSWNHVISIKGLGDQNILSISFRKGSIPVASLAFHRFIDDITLSSTDLYLLGKNKRLTSISDWHDLMIVAFKRTSPRFLSWYQSFEEVYRYYASKRLAFSMLEPRPAIAEASAIHNLKINIKYFDNADVCTIPKSFESSFTENTRLSMQSYVNQISKSYKQHLSGNHKRKSHHDLVYVDSRCHSNLLDHVQKKDFAATSQSAMEIYCSPNKHSLDICLTTNLPVAWKKEVPRDINHNIGFLGATSTEELLKDPFKMMWKGLLRFRNTPSLNITRPFCWEDPKNTHELKIRVDMEYNVSYSIPFTHPQYDYYQKNPTKIKAVIMSASEGAAEKLDIQKYITISKMSYAKRHGYDFAYAISDEFAEYFPKDLYEPLRTHVNMEYFRGIMSKVTMMLDVMYRHLSDDWLVFTDDDVFINTGWLYLPLDIFLADVPSHKVIVLANYRSTFTNVVLIRNNQKGRRLMHDWLAIAMSGYIQCHGFDQAALAALIAQRVGRETSFPLRPLNFSCIFTNDQKLGCNAKGDWSCDFKIEAALYRSGFKTLKSIFYGEKISSFSSGCANDVIDDFHVLTETTERPRLQCGHCTRLEEVESADHWDGPLGGGNLPLMAGKINGYFFNHKSEFLMYESYLKDYGCLYVNDVVPPCKIQALHDHLPLAEVETLMQSKGRHLVSLTDGYAFDLDVGTYCKLSNKHIIENQHTKTYMSQYEGLIKVLEKIPEKEFWEIYKRSGDSDGRHTCHGDTGYNCQTFGAYEDGQVKRRPKPWTKDITDVLGLPANVLFFVRENYCETCRKVKRTYPLGNHEYGIDCRTEEEERKEIMDKVNLDYYEPS